MNITTVTMSSKTANGYASQIRPIYKSHKITVRKGMFFDGYEIHINEGDGYESTLRYEESAQDYLRIHSED